MNFMVVRVEIQREKTLLKEYEQSKKSSVFVDKRIGEQSEELGEFDKAILRSQRERQVRFHKFLTSNTLTRTICKFENIYFLVMY